MDNIKIRIGINALSLRPSHKGGAEAVFLNLAKGFVGNGFAKNIVYFCYPSMANELRCLSDEFEIVSIDITINEKHGRFGAEWIQTTVFHKIYKKYNLDVILFTNSEVGFLKYNIPTLVIPHDIQNVSKPEINKSKFQYWANYLSYLNDFRKMDRIIAISIYDQREIEQYYPFTSNKIIQIYNPIDIKLSDITIIPNKEKMILAVNIQYPHKNIEILIKAFAIFHKKYADYKLILVGAKNKFTERLEDLVEKLKLTKNVIFTGFISKSELEFFWRRTALYVNPSKFEGFGMTSVESILYGAPTLLGNLEVNNEVTDGICYFFNNLDDEQELAEVMEKIIKAPYDADDYYDKAYKIADKYDLCQISLKYIESICELTHKR